MHGPGGRRPHRLHQRHAGHGRGERPDILQHHPQGRQLHHQRYGHGLQGLLRKSVPALSGQRPPEDRCLCPGAFRCHGKEGKLFYRPRFGEHQPADLLYAAPLFGVASGDGAALRPSERNRGEPQRQPDLRHIAGGLHHPHSAVGHLLYLFPDDLQAAQGSGSGPRGGPGGHPGQEHLPLQHEP